MLEMQETRPHSKELWPIPMLRVPAVGTRPHFPELPGPREGPGGMGAQCKQQGMD